MRYGVGVIAVTTLWLDKVDVDKQCSGQEIIVRQVSYLALDEILFACRDVAAVVMIA